MPPQAINSEDFAGFFRGVHGFDPYPWQERLTRRVLDTGIWPQSVELPTGSGKTALVDIAVFALAALPETMPRRVVFVINRRTVVDQAYEHVAKLQEALQVSDEPSVRRVADRLIEVCGDAPINGIRLRGGVHHQGSWADRPDTAWVTVSTIDLFGSKLLFRAYGSARRMRPVQAGLAGNDCLVILDEAHLDQPFVETMRQVRDWQPGLVGMPRRYQVVAMSATLAESESFGLDEDDLTCAELVRRVSAPKEANLLAIDWGQPHETIPAAVSRLASDLDYCEQTVGVVVNRVRTAREVHRALSDAGHVAHLVTGRMRPLDRDDVVRAVQGAVDPDRDTDSGKTTFVVATQCIEAGADYSFDAMVTEVAPIDSMRQRFGRLDRRGKLSARRGRAARAWIVGPSDPKAAPDFSADPVYGGAVAATWAKLLKVTNKGRVLFDASPLAKHQFPEEALAPRLEAPLLLPHHLDAWAQTNPEPAQVPPIDRFLHGMLSDSEARRLADVSIVWRYDRSLAAIRAVPIRAVEKLQVPWRAAVAWMHGHAETEVSDAGTEVVGAGGRRAGRGGTIAQEWVRWTGYDAPPDMIAPGDIRPGDVLLVDPTRGGLAHGTWSPSSRAVVSDLGDAAQHAHQRRFSLRLDSRLHGGLQRPPRPSDDTVRSETERIDEWLRAIAAASDQPVWMCQTLDKVMTPGRRVRRVGSGREAYFVVSAGAHVEADAMDGSDESQSATGAGVSLRDHLTGVGARARSYAERLQLSPEMCADLELAARLHDIGKADPRFQRQLVGGDEVALSCLEEPLAKSLPQARTDPDGWPAVHHELVSVLMARDGEGLRSAHDRELVLHLIGSHHGRTRSLPLLRRDREHRCIRYSDGSDDYEARTVDAGPELANEMAERFWRLTRRYGHHGLAWLETILRQADQQQSAYERVAG